MSALGKISDRLDPAEVFASRCSARAYLVFEGEWDFHDAVDGLQQAAVASGLVAALSARWCC